MLLKKLDLLGINEKFKEIYNVLQGVKVLHIMCNLQLLPHNYQEVIDRVRNFVLFSFWNFFLEYHVLNWSMQKYCQRSSQQHYIYDNQVPKLQGVLTWLAKTHFWIFPPCTPHLPPMAPPTPKVKSMKLFYTWIFQKFQYNLAIQSLKNRIHIFFIRIRLIWVK